LYNKQLTKAGEAWNKWKKEAIDFGKCSLDIATTRDLKSIQDKYITAAYAAALYAEMVELQRKSAPEDHRMSVNFNIMVCGESGQGKTTFLQTLYKAIQAQYEDAVFELEPESQRNELEPESQRNERTLRIQKVCSFKLRYNNNIEVTCYDTPGYGM
jgi:type IV secretory pathway ATPase VirB11/archaellum biosynthesis ATPase